MDREQILKRAQALTEAELFRRLEEAGQRLPHRCVNNHRQPLDVRREVDGAPNPAYNRIQLGSRQTIGLCMLGSDNPEEWAGTVCEDAIDAQRCPYFTPIQDRAAVIQQFREELKDGAWVDANMPRLGELLRILGQTEAPGISFWAKVRLRYTRIRIEPLRVTIDPVLLLPEGTDESSDS